MHLLALIHRRFSVLYSNHFSFKFQYKQIRVVNKISLLFYDQTFHHN
nr:MAG TPA: hypothetical protein [Caudoviricetes sp.]